MSARPPAPSPAYPPARARQTTHRYAQRAMGICINNTRHIHVVAGHPGEGASQVHDKGKRHPRDIVAASVASVVHEHFDKRISHLPCTVASPFYFSGRPSAEPSVHLSARPSARPCLRQLIRPTARQTTRHPEDLDITPVMKLPCHCPAILEAMASKCNMFAIVRR